VYLEVVGWEEVPSGIAAEPQEVINRYVGDDYDIFLGLMGQTLGSPTARAVSGTVEEYGRALRRWRASPATMELAFYFKTVRSSAAGPGYDQVLAFRERLTRDGLLYKDFRTGPDLEAMARNDLGAIMDGWLNRSQAGRRAV
jgi:hypothetical protein